MPLPTLLVEFSPTTGGTQTPTWVDISSFVRACSLSRGRRSEYDQPQTGECDLLLDNRARTFDPSYAAGPYYGNLRPMRRLRVRATSGGVTYPLFSGFVERWPQVWESNADGTVPLKAVDGFKVLNLARLTTSYAQQLSSDRVKAVLDDVLWGSGQAWVLGDATYGVLGTTTLLAPVGDRSISVGASSVQASTLADVPALQHLLDVQATENGRLFVGADGSLVFQDRLRAVSPPYDTSQALFGDAADGSELPYVDLVTSYDDEHLYTDVVVTREGGTAQTASSSAARTEFWPRTLSVRNLATSDGEALTAANWWLYRTSSPTLRIDRITLDLAHAAVIPQALGRELGDRVTVRRRPKGGALIEQVSLLEYVQHQIEPGHWTCTWQLSPADTRTYWVLGSSTLESGTNPTRLAY